MSEEAIAVAESAPAFEHPLNDAVPGAITGTWAEETEAALIVAPENLLLLLRHLKESEGYDFL